MSDVSTIKTESIIRNRALDWLADFDNFGRIGEDNMARISTLTHTEIATRLNVEPSVVLGWLRKYDIPRSCGTFAPDIMRVPLIEYPVLKALSEGKSIDEARAVVADVRARLEERA